MKKSFILVTVVALLVMLAPGCAPEGAQAPTPPAPEQVAPSPTSEPTSTGEEGNFRLLLSDEVNAIEDFEHLHVTISGIGLKQGGESGTWIEHELDPEADPDGDGVPGIDLTTLQGDNATEIWNGYAEPGEYIKVFIHVDNVTGILDGADEGEADVKLPSDKLQISKPFTLSPDFLVSFVFDITVVESGKSGKYVLKPQIAQSGPDKDFNDVTAKGKPEGEEAEELEFEGIIETIDGTTWTMTIDGETRTVDVSEAEIVGEPAVDLEAKLRGTVVDDTIVASEAEIRETGG